MANKEYIEREAVEKFITKGLNNPDKAKAYGYDAVEILSEIHHMDAADVVEVVRCKDCRHLSDSGGSYWCKETGFEMKSYELEHFCSYGERKE